MIRRCLTLALLSLALVLVPGSASGQVCPEQAAPHPEHSTHGLGGLMDTPGSDGSTPRDPDGYYSAYGHQGTAGAKWHTIITDNCFQAERYSPKVHFSDWIWTASLFVNQATITIYQAAAGEALIATISDLVADMITWLRDGIWEPLLPSAIIIGAVWLAWVGLVRKRVTLTLESVLWMVLSTAIGIWVMANPGSILGLSSMLANATGSLVHESLSGASTTGYRCPAPSGDARPDRDGPASEKAEELTPVQANSEMLYSGLVCEPWQAGYFGTGDRSEDAANEHGEDLLRAQAFRGSELEDLENQDNSEERYQELVEQKNADFEAINDAMSTDYPELYPIWSGQDQDTRTEVALTSLAGSLLAGSLILVISITLLVLKVIFLLLLMLSPIFFLIGVHPGEGRIILQRWAESLLGVWFKQAFLILLMAVIVILYGRVMALPFTWGWKLVLLFIVLLAIFTQRKRLTAIFNADPKSMVSRAMSKAANDDTMSKVIKAQPPVAFVRHQAKWGPKAAGAALGFATGRGTLAKKFGSPKSPPPNANGPNPGSGSPPNTPHPSPNTPHANAPDKGKAPPLHLGSEKPNAPSRNVAAGRPERPTLPSPPAPARAPSNPSGSSSPTGDDGGRRRAVDDIAARAAHRTHHRRTESPPPRRDPPPRRVEVDETIVVEHHQVHRDPTTPPPTTSPPRRVQRPLTRIYRPEER